MLYYFVLKASIPQPLCRLFLGNCALFFTLFPRVMHAITWNTAKTPWKTHPTQDETENKDKASRLGELTHIWSTGMNIYRGKTMQLVCISQYPAGDQVILIYLWYLFTLHCSRTLSASASRLKVRFHPHRPTYGWRRRASALNILNLALPLALFGGEVTIAWLVSLRSCQALDRPKVWTPHKQNV